jgi:sugar/nucleoside kinase (ribokinase family)
MLDPVQHINGFSEGLPPGLIGYSGEEHKTPSRMASKPTAIREEDLPTSYQSATSAHLCPLDYLSHNLLPAVLRKQGFSSITLQPCADYMDPAYFSDIPSLITGLTGFIPTDDDLFNLYRGKSMDLWAIAEDLGRHGCEMVIIQRGIAGSSLYESGTGRKFEIEAYPTRVVNPIGASDAFCGGFMAGLRQTHDPVQAVLYGNVAYSLMIEGHGPFYPLQAITGLASARLEYLQSRVREI